MKDSDKTKVELTKEVKTLRKERGKSALDNITERKQVEGREGQPVTEMDFLYKTALDFIQLDPKEDIYRFVCKKLKEIVGDSIVSVSSYDKASDSIKVCALEGVRGKTKKVLKIVGKNPFTMSFPINNEEARNAFISGELIKVPGGIYELTFGQIPKSICHVLEKFLNVGKIYACGFAKGKELFGSTLIILPKNIELNNREFINAFIKQSAIMLQSKQAEEALRVSEEKYRALLTNVNDLVMEIDSKGKLTYVSPQIFDMFGYTQEESIGLNVMSFVHPDDIKKYMKAMEDLDQVKHFEYRSRHKDGHYVHVSNSGRIIHDETGGFKIISVLRDITERKRAEEELRLHAAMINNIAEGINLVGWDDLLIKWTNDRFVKMFGYNPGELVGKQVEILNAPTERTPSETQISIVDALKETGEWHGEIRNIKRDGTLFWCYVSVSLFDHPDGKIIVSVHTDITERKLAEEALQIKDWVIESAVNAIATSDLAGNLNYINPMFLKMWGYSSPVEVMGKPAVEFWQMAEKAAEILEALRTKGGWMGELVAQRKDGTLFDVQVGASMVMDAAGQPVCMQASFADITQRKQAQDALKKAHDQLEEKKDVSDWIEKGNTKEKLL